MGEKLYSNGYIIAINSKGISKYHGFHNNKIKKTQYEMKGEREITASAARSLWCQGKLMNIVYVVSSEQRESFVSSMSEE